MRSRVLTVLTTPDLNKEFKVETDISNFATGGVLSMKYLWRLVAFILKLLNETEQNYKIHDKEILEVIRCLETWKHFLCYNLAKQLSYYLIFSFLFFYY